MARQDDRGGGFDDLFEDLDEFFKDEAPTQPPPAAAQPPAIAAEPPADRPPPDRDRTTRMPDRDWRRLQDVLGEEEDGHELDVPGEVSEFDDEVEEPGAGLAGLSEVRRPRAARAETGGSGTVAGVPAAAAAPGAGTGEPPPSEEPGEDERFFSDMLWDERTIEEVGSTADRLSEEFADASAAPPPAARPPTARPPAAPAGAPTERPGPRTIRVTEPEDISEPSFRPPSRRGFASAFQPPADGGRNVPLAILTGVGLAALGLILLAVKAWLFAILASAVVLLAQAELYRAMQRRGYQPATALGLVMGGLALAGAYLKGEAGMLLFAALTVVLSFLWFLVVPSRLREHALANMGATVLGVAYVPLMAGYILMILSQADEGRAVMLAVLGLTFLYDVSAFVVGSNWGSRPLAPSVSPRKTWEGLFGGTAITFIVAVVLLPLTVGVFSFARAVGLFVVVALFAPLGDLAESSIKRDLGVKDMGTILPGHGGALDRIDSVLFVAPFAFYFFRLFF